ncbi:hypothetical protein TraAM80_08864 [Trypanosoma rangeli]|uniref:Uncharacterized protein n=1 Tax=Trypanosoma rangeli TaxID=5698 RepID=A0A3R7JXP1_TRYRA|nr:uncharacterized protein TraAM80_08864 [Trypanosoma rangeli]RNE98502.1 hypothetical protein TraAM80_08864 [Trypanosoma rangeli]|eukprot:RNE98502.1 hypothetical protein TraAM80_08864 [Trypanosoma rangeli]
MATILESNSFCDVLPTVMLRVEPAPVAMQHHFIVSARHGYMLPVHNYTCQVRLFFEQMPAEEMVRMQDVFALGLPLAFLLLAAPFLLWRIDLLPGYLVDIDVISWLWYLPYLLRDAVIKAAVGGRHGALGDLPQPTRSCATASAGETASSPHAGDRASARHARWPHTARAVSAAVAARDIRGC